MPYFTNTDELYSVMDRLWTYIKSEEEICGKITKFETCGQIQVQRP